ncbi:MAG TPA: PAS domain S-box protein [Methylomirabilota bacterium]|nr:PAS domain S-box protein [Methylomirabilota bacterium]
MRAFSIKRKLMLIIMTVSTAALLLMALGSMAYEWTAFRQQLQSVLDEEGEIIGEGATGALLFDDKSRAEEILSAFRHNTHIRSAAIYSGTNALFASYPKTVAQSAFPVRPQTDVEYHRFDLKGDRLMMWQPLKQEGNVVGTIYIESDLQEIRTRLMHTAEMFSLLILVTLAFTYFLSSRLQRVISRPISQLMKTVKTVSAEKNYSVRAMKESEDELGQLVDGFNEMIGQIQQRDGALRNINKELEKRVELRTRELLEAELKFHSVVQSANEGIIAADHHGKIISWNQGAEKIFGCAEADVLGEPLAIIMPERHRAMHEAGVKRFLASGEGKVLGRTIEIEGVRSDGSEFPVELSLATWRTDKGIFFSGIVRDITERRRAAEELQQQFTRINLLNQIIYAVAERQDLDSIVSIVLRQLEDKLPVDYGSAYFYDAQTEIFTALVRGPKSQAIAEELQISKTIPLAHTLFRPCLEGEMVYIPDANKLDLVVPKKMAEAGFHTVIAAPLTGEGKMFGVLVLQRREMDAFSAAERDFIHGLSAHVALAIHQAQLYQDLQTAYNELRQSQQTIMQQERLKALGQMASGVAHDINNALSPIVGFADLIGQTEQNLSPLAKKHLNYIKTAGEDVAHIVERLREFYRPRDDRELLAMLNLNSVVEQAVGMTRPRWRDIPQSHGVMVELGTDLDSNAPDFAGIETEIRECLTNLILNAVDAMPSGGVITIRTHMADAGVSNRANVSEYVLLEVKDTGVGMDEKTRRRCLEPFFSTKGKRGTGLGLAMVYGVVERHEGQIEIDSEPGKGTTVRLIFPVYKLEPSTAFIHQDDVPPGPFRILCVDDEPPVRELVREMLERDGHTIVSADGGQAGIETFRAAQNNGQRFDAVITDLGMPYVDGREVAAAVKRESPDTPVIMLTGWGAFMKGDNATPVHVDGILSKPPRIRELRAMLRKVVKK